MKVQYIAVHCSATPPDMNIGVGVIRQWHLANGWDDVGYHIIIRRNGKIEYGRNFDTPGAHVKGFNNKSIGVCLVGGVSSNMEAEDNFTDEQFRSLDRVLIALHGLFPQATVRGHRDFPNVQKACPSFDVYSWCDERQIYFTWEGE